MYMLRLCVWIPWQILLETLFRNPSISQSLGMPMLSQDPSSAALAAAQAAHKDTTLEALPQCAAEMLQGGKHEEPLSRHRGIMGLLQTDEAQEGCSGAWVPEDAYQTPCYGSLSRHSQEISLLSIYRWNAPPSVIRVGGALQCDWLSLPSWGPLLNLLECGALTDRPHR